MKKMLRVIALSALLPTTALAQQVPPPPPFAPVVLEKEPYDQIVAYINTRLPTGEGRPLIEALERLEVQAAMKAQADADAAAKKPSAEPPKPADPH